MSKTPLTLYEKLWQAHVVRRMPDGSSLLYIDRHLIHEVTSPQAFEGLRLAGRKPWRVSASLATPDHNVPTENQAGGISDPVSRLQVDTLDQNCRDTGIRELPMLDPRQGIVHVIGPELGATLPGMTVVCGDSHTSTHGALGALAFGIGTSEVEHVLATQCLLTQSVKTFRITVNGCLTTGVTAKDLALALIGRIGTAGGTGTAIEFAGPVIRALSMEGRMTLCNMAIEAGARSGMVAVDDITLDYVQGRDFAPKGEEWAQAVACWSALHSDAGAVFDRELDFDAGTLRPQLTWGTSPEMVVSIDGCTPDPAQESDSSRASDLQRALDYMGLHANQRLDSVAVDKVFIGSCTNARIEDLRAAAGVVRGRKVADSIIEALVVPGSGRVKQQAEAEGLDKIFQAAGFSWREPGCSMCLAMNADRLEAGQRCASTSNRNFEGRQGKGGRTHLVSPLLAAAAAVAGHFCDPQQL